ncbi:hypothetical protein WG70_21930 [Burkholderia oklahomensis EO147]|nr:hypothetical protein WG70_21930 [Burkholderia oklahomensis EO147]KUY55816.1 hypothetical protein WG70_11210 [Burkholderia oklahomensis EO147]
MHGFLLEFGIGLPIGQPVDKSIRRLLVRCARACMQRLDRQSGRLADWGRTMLTQRHANVVACALANKLMRTARARASRHTAFNAGTSVMPA